MIQHHVLQGNVYSQAANKTKLHMGKGQTISTFLVEPVCLQTQSGRWIRVLIYYDTMASCNLISIDEEDADEVDRQPHPRYEKAQFSGVNTGKTENVRLLRLSMKCVHTMAVGKIPMIAIEAYEKNWPAPASTSNLMPSDRDHWKPMDHWTRPQGGRVTKGLASQPETTVPKILLGISSAELFPISVPNDLLPKGWASRHPFLRVYCSSLTYHPLFVGTVQGDEPPVTYSEVQSLEAQCKKLQALQTGRPSAPQKPPQRKTPKVSEQRRQPVCDPGVCETCCPVCSEELVMPVMVSGSVSSGGATKRYSSSYSKPCSCVKIKQLTGNNHPGNPDHVGDYVYGVQSKSNVSSRGKAIYSACCACSACTAYRACMQSPMRTTLCNRTVRQAPKPKVGKCSGHLHNAAESTTVARPVQNKCTKNKFLKAKQAVSSVKTAKDNPNLARSLGRSIKSARSLSISAKTANDKPSKPNPFKSGPTYDLTKTVVTSKGPGLITKDQFAAVLEEYKAEVKAHLKAKNEASYEPKNVAKSPPSSPLGARPKDPKDITKGVLCTCKCSCSVDLIYCACVCSCTFSKVWRERIGRMKQGGQEVNDSPPKGEPTTCPTAPSIPSDPPITGYVSEADIVTIQSDSDTETTCEPKVVTQPPLVNTPGGTSGIHPWVKQWEHQDKGLATL